jgi:NAD(P)-dependent dehydrogenase (short-subunit alcohol dehydrogenase family)
MSLSIDFSGRSAIVVGGSGGGIGSAISLALAEAGAHVGVVTAVAEHAEEVLAQIRQHGVSGAVEIADVTNEDALRTAMRSLADAIGQPQHLVNVVGGAPVQDWDRLEDLNMESFRRVVARNLDYALVACQEVAGPLIRSGQGGSIVNISSIAARGAPLLGAYSTGKGGLESLSRTMALEWGPAGIRVNLVAPGTIKTPRSGSDDNPKASAGIPLRRRGLPDDIASATMFLLSDMSGYITGQTLVADGGSSIGSGGQVLPAAVTNPAIRAKFE